MARHCRRPGTRRRCQAAIEFMDPTGLRRVDRPGFTGGSMKQGASVRARRCPFLGQAGRYVPFLIHVGFPTLASAGR
jgi:hypothetical protein